VKYFLILRIQVYKDNKIKLIHLIKAEIGNEFLIFKNILLIHEFNKNLINIKKLIIINKRYKCLIKVIKEFKKLVLIKFIKDKDINNKINIFI
jgi:hypothetical protein